MRDFEPSTWKSFAFLVFILAMFAFVGTIEHNSYFYVPR